MKKRRHERQRAGRAAMQGHLLVTGSGELLIEQPLQRSRALQLRSPDVVVVCWGDDPEMPACVPCVPDQLRWDVIQWTEAKCGKHKHDQMKEGELYLIIKWKVAYARTVLWKVMHV